MAVPQHRRHQLYRAISLHGSFRTYLGTLFGLLSLLLALAVSLVLGSITRAHLERLTGYQLAEHAYQLADKLDRGMFERSRDVELLARLPVFRTPAASVETQRQLLEDVQRMDPSYAWIGIIEPSGVVRVSTGGLLEGMDSANRPVFRFGKHNAFVGDVHDAVLLASLLPSADDEPIRLVDLAAPMRDSNGSLLGVLGAHLSWTWAREVERSLLVVDGDRHHTDFFVLSQDGTVLLGPDLTDIPLGQLTLPSVTAARQGQRGFVLERWPNGQQYLTGYIRSQGYHSYPGLGWIILARQPVDVAFGPARQLELATLLWGSLIGVVMAVVAFVIAGRVVAPLRRIAQAADAIRQGQTETSIPLPRRHDEIAQLAATLRQMVATLTAQERALRESNARLQDELAVRHQVEAQLLHAQKLESIGQLAGGIAHDFNNLLTAITGYVELAQDTLHANHPAAGDLREAQHAVQRARALTRQLLTFARKQAFAPQVIQLNTVIQQVENLLRRLLGTHIHLIVQTDPQLAPVMADPSQIEQVLVNLAVNARDAMPQGGTLIVRTAMVTVDETQVASLAPGRYARVEVQDTGSGMDAAVKQRLFEPFFTTKGPGQGTGLGLATCYGILTQHHGAITCDSVLGQGTTFQIYLPAYVGTVNDHPEGNADTARVQGHETILLVEDDPVVRSLATRVLQSHGYAVVTAVDGDDGMRCLHEVGADVQLLITDIVMPGLSGRALATYARTHYPSMRTLLISGYSADLQELHDGPVPVLPKPFTPAQLVLCVRALLDRPPDQPHP